MKRFILLILLTAAWTGPVWAQRAPAPTTATDQMVEVDPIRCWWRASAGAIRIGENFDLVLTCAVLENELVQVVPDESRLAGAVISLAPFEMVASGHPADLRSGSRRFFQYSYTIRIINPDAIGTDVGVPIMSLHYRVNSKIAANASLQGRDLTYVLPPQPIKVLSLVTADAPDIRDASEEGFNAVEGLRLRAGVLQIAALTLVALGVLMIIAILIRLLRGFRKEATTEKLMGDYSILQRAGRELADIQRVVDAGWNGTLAARALGATRIAAACAIGKRVSQRSFDTRTRPEEGKLIAKHFLSRDATALSSAVTAEDVAQAQARLSETSDPSRRQMLDELQTALTAFGQLQYGRDTAADRTTLDAALSAASAATSRLKSDNMWPRPLLRRWSRQSAQVEHQA